MKSNQVRFYQIMLEQLSKVDEYQPGYLEELQSVMAEIINLERTHQQGAVYGIQNKVNDIIEAASVALTRKVT